MPLSLRPVMHLTEGPKLSTDNVVMYEVIGLPCDQDVRISQHAHVWQVLWTAPNVHGRWAGRFDTAEQALDFVQLAGTTCARTPACTGIVRYAGVDTNEPETGAWPPAPLRRLILVCDGCGYEIGTPSPFGTCHFCQERDGSCWAHAFGPSERNPQAGSLDLSLSVSQTEVEGSVPCCQECLKNAQAAAESF